MRVDVGQPEHKGRANQDRDGVFRIGSILSKSTRIVTYTTVP
jgi:hypothetical protein